MASCNTVPQHCDLTLCLFVMAALKREVWTLTVMTRMNWLSILKGWLECYFSSTFAGFGVCLTPINCSNFLYDTCSFFTRSLADTLSIPRHHRQFNTAQLRTIEALTLEYTVSSYGTYYTFISRDLCYLVTVTSGNITRNLTS